MELLRKVLQLPLWQIGKIPEFMVTEENEKNEISVENKKKNNIQLFIYH